MRQEYIDLYDAYTHEHLDRRRFMRRMAELAGGTAAAAAIIEAIEANYAQAAMIAPNDERLVIERVAYPGAGGDVQAYLVRPAEGAGTLPAIMVIHENRGLNPHIEDVARRAALAGFVAVAPDFLSPLGGTPDDPDAARDMIGKLDAAQTTENALATVAYLEGHPQSTGKVGVVGFCWGGALTNQTAVHAPSLGAAVAFYGRQPTAEEAAQIKAPIMLHYAGLDERINAGIEDYETALKAAGVDYTLYVYDGVNHAFHNDTSAERYDKAAADLAWSRTIDFFREKLAA
jgi:carboxymethylenebutenolidase